MSHAAGTFHQYAPGPPLADFVESLWISEGYAPSHALERLLPAGTMDLVFSLDGDGKTSGAVVGPQTECVVLDTSRPLSVMGVHFNPGGGAPFFGMPSNALHNESLAVDVAWGASGATLRDRLWEARTPERRFRIVEAALLHHGRGRWDRHPAVRYALTMFDRSRGTSPVGDVMQQIGLSTRRFIDVFRREVGLTPKVFCRLRRFDEALKEIESRRDVDWVDVALSCGYFDQAHFNHDFRAFSGLTPSEYLRHRTARRHVAVVA